MSRIRIKNFGPIKIGRTDNDGWIDIKKVTLFVGNQGSGKSTVAKLISTFLWIEKALVRGDYDIKWFTEKNRFIKTFLSYHRLENYIDENSNKTPEIEFVGEEYSITYKDKKLTISSLRKGEYILPQIMYVPAERNFISYVRSTREIKNVSMALNEFIEVFDLAKEVMKDTVLLPINNVGLQYDRLNDNFNIKGADYKIRLSHASTGFHSIVPLYLVSKHLAESVKDFESNIHSMTIEQTEQFRKESEIIMTNNALTEAQKRIALKTLSSRFNKGEFINIIEEPEQNLFPSSQWELLKSLLTFNNYSHGNKLILTTHSPYFINYLSIVIQAAQLMPDDRDEHIIKQIDEIVPLLSLHRSDDVAIYQLNEEKGTISLLSNYEGIPSDKNFLNIELEQGNILFDKLLEIEDEI